MISRTLAIMRKEFLHIVRDPITLFLIFLIPVIQMVMLGYAVTTNVENIGIAIWDKDQSTASHRLATTLNDTDYFDVTHYVVSEKQMKALLDAGKVRAALIIPEEFGKNLLGGQGVEVELVIDGSDPAVANTMIAAALQMVQKMNEAHGVAQPPTQGPAGGILAGILPRTVGMQIKTTVLYNPDLKSVNYMIPALMGIIMQFLAPLLTAMAIVRERERGTIEQLIVTPIRAGELVIGKTAPYILLTSFDLIEVLLVAILWFHVPINGSVPLLLALSALFLLGALGIGILVSTAAHTQQEAMLLSMMFLLPSIFLSGFIFPLEAMPWVLRALSYLVPVRYMLIVIRSLVLKGAGFETLQTEVIILAIFCVVILVAAARRFRKSLD